MSNKIKKNRSISLNGPFILLRFSCLLLRMLHLSSLGRTKTNLDGSHFLLLTMQQILKLPAPYLAFASGPFIVFSLRKYLQSFFALWITTFRSPSLIKLQADQISRSLKVAPTNVIWFLAVSSSLQRSTLNGSSFRPLHPMHRAFCNLDHIVPFLVLWSTFLTVRLMWPVFALDVQIVSLSLLISIGNFYHNP